MGRKRKRHSAEQSYGGTPSQEQEMRVVLRLPGAYEEEDEEEQTWSSSLHHHHPSHYHSGVAEPPVECVVSIPLPLLRQAAQSQASEPATSSDQHRHKKHKKKKKHRPSHEAAAPTPDPPSQSASQESFQPFIEHPPLPKLTLPKPSPAAVLPSSERGPSSQSGLIASDDPDRKHHSHRHKHHHHHHKKSRHSEEGASLAPKQEWLSPPIAAAAATRPPPVELFQQTPRLGGSSSEISPPVLPPAPLDSGHKHKKKKKKHKHSRSGSEHSLSQTAFSGTRPPHEAVPLVPPYSSPSLSGKSLATAPPEHLPSVKRVRISEDVALPPPPVLKPVVPAAVKELQKPEKIVTFSETTPLASLSSKPHHPPHPPHPHHPPQPEAIAVRSQAAEVQLKTHAGSLIHSTVRPAAAVAPPPAGHTRPHPSPQKEMKPFKSKPVVVTAPPPPPPPPTSTPHQSHHHTDTTSTQPPTKTLQVNLSRTALKLFLKNLHHQIQRRDLEGIFIEPVTDDIAPGYSSIIAHSMDLGTMGSKIENSDYTAVSEFKDDFALMCNNAMTYNTPDTVYYATAKKLLSSGLKIIAKEVSMRPDILHGKVLSSAATSRAGSASPLPDFRLPLPSSAAFDYASPCVCRIELGALRSARSQAPLLLPPPPQTLPPTSLLAGLAKSLAAVPRPELVSTALETATPLTDQSHLTKVSVGVVEDETEMGVVGGAESPEEVLVQVREAAEAAKENLGSTRPPVRLCYVERDQHSNRTMLNFINPDTSEVDSSRPVDLSVLSEQVRMGNNAATVLKTELPMMKATPVSYLMYGPFGSFAPAYDSTFATLSKMDSDLLLSSYSSDIGVSYAHSLQQFVKGTGSFVSEMADAVLNGLTNGRHSKFTEKFRSFEESERRAKASLRLDGGGGGGGGGGGRKELSQRGERPSSTPLPASGNSQKNDDDVVIISPSSSRGDSPCEGPPSLDGASLVDDGPSSPPSRLAAPAVSIAAGNGRLPLQDATEEGETVVLDGGVVDRELFEGESPGEDEGGLSSLGGGEISSSGRGSSSSSSGSSSGGSSEGRGLSPSSPPSEPNSNSKVANNQEQLCTVSSRLQQTSELLGTLQEQQRQRLAQPPRLDADTGHVLLPGPSREEISTASRLSKELASMTSQVRPQDVVAVAGIHKAMGVSLQHPEPTSLPTHTDPYSSS